VELNTLKIKHKILWDLTYLRFEMMRGVKTRERKELKRCVERYDII